MITHSKNNFNLYVTSVLFAAVFAAVSEVELSGRSYVAASSSRIAYNVPSISAVAELELQNFKLRINVK